MWSGEITFDKISNEGSQNQTFRADLLQTDGRHCIKDLGSRKAKESKRLIGWVIQSSL